MDGLAAFLLLAIVCGPVTATVQYNTGAKPVPGKLNVHLVPHTHDDLGWLLSLDEYYVGPDSTHTDLLGHPAVQFIIHTVVQELEEDPNRKFSYVETGFFVRWWRQQTKAKQEKVRKLVASGQLLFINGGWCMHDEATTHYIDMIDQTTLGHRHLKNYFGIVPRHGWQIDPFGHSAVQAYLLSAEVGFDSMFVARIDYQDRVVRKAKKTMEMIWRGSETLGASAEVFMDVFPVHYSPPNSFEFEISDSAYNPVQDDPKIEGYNIDQRVNDLVQQAQQQSALTRTNHVMFTMGDDFTYQTASTWFSPMDKLIHYANLDGRVNVLYSNPSIYVESKFAANETWPLKTGDFFPYADGPDSYWTGYFTSRAALKGYVRTLSAYLQAARQLEFSIGRQSDGSNTDSLEEAMATAQHHDCVSGTEKQAVADDYAKHLYIGAEESQLVINRALDFWTGGSNATTSAFQHCGLLNVTYCPASEASMEKGTSLVVVAYNALAWVRSEFISIPVSSENLAVTDLNGIVVPSQILPISNTTKKVRDFYVEANLGVVLKDGPLFHLVFEASVPPLGFTSFSVGPSNGTGAATVSVVETHSPNATVQIGNGSLQLTFSTKTGLLTSSHNRNTGTVLNVSQTNLWYEGLTGATQSSGAYIFLPANDKPTPVGHATSATSYSIVRGPLVEEIRQVFSPWVSQVTRVYKDQDHAEVEFTIGPIPIDDGVGKEVITRFSTGIASDKVFYTDSNGRDFLKRVRDHRDWPLTVVQPVAGNYYPIGLGMYIGDNETEFSLLVDRAVGGASIEDGQLELMLHRRLMADDGRGVGEPLNEQVCLSSDDSQCEGLTITGRYFMSTKSSADAAKWRRTQGQAILSPLLLAFTTEQGSGTWKKTHTPQVSAMAANTSLPANVALITLQELDTGSVLLRLAHLYQANEHAELSQLATVNLQDILVNRKIVNATEMSLTANQVKAEMNQKLQWNVEGDHQTKQAVRGAAFDPATLRVELAPMEIRTFELTVI